MKEFIKTLDDLRPEDIRFPFDPLNKKLCFGGGGGGTGATRTVPPRNQGELGLGPVQPDRALVAHSHPSALMRPRVYEPVGA